ncbi:hypothetical protein P4198_19865 [Pseudomonas aeruginosa]|nr:hypothetical protein [Pseudomonas aeruginosa]MDF5943692.1 hypothetical protein [Pseudomonas aeruginosa]
MRRGLWMIFRWPLLLALLGLFGLLSALLGDGLYDLLSWLALGTPLVLVGWASAAPAANPKEPLR